MDEWMEDGRVWNSVYGLLTTINNNQRKPQNKGDDVLKSSLTKKSLETTLIWDFSTLSSTKSKLKGGPSNEKNCELVYLGSLIAGRF